MTDQPDEMDPTAETAYTKLTTKVKRGTGTRDQDTTKVTTRHPDPEQAVYNHQIAVDLMREMVDKTRSIQPGETDD